MATIQTTDIIRHVRSAAVQDGAGLTDGQLLSLFIEHRDGAAFAAIVNRHGRMVWGVCRRLVGHHDAEDAFQAAFLVLARKAASIRPREMAANWLYGVARQAAFQVRRAAARRRGRERQVREMPEPEAPASDRCADLQLLLDLELGGLPDKYRAVIVLGDLEGMTRKEVARQLGCPEGTVAGRLARARAMLARRMARYGLAVTGGALAMVISEQAASASVPSSVVSSTIRAANLLAAGRAAAAGTVSVKVAALTEGVLKAMILTKLKTATAVLLAVAALSGVAGLTYGAQARETPAAAQAEATFFQRTDGKVAEQEVKKNKAVPGPVQPPDPRDGKKPKEGPDATAGAGKADDHGAAAPAADKPAWVHDLDEAKKQAAASKKDLLILFTGRGWCYHCDVLDREVFQQAAFVGPAQRDFVFVEFDFTFGDAPEEKARAARYQKLQQHYLVRAFPTIVLADAGGVPYAIQSGYADGTGVIGSLALMRLAQAAKAQRDQSFRIAATSAGAERAKALHEGIQWIAGFLGSLDDRGDDPVLTFYQSQVQDIMRADAPEAGAARAGYEARRKDRDDWLKREAVFIKLREFKEAKDYRGAIAYLDDQLKRADDPDVTWRLEQQRQGYLEWDEQYGEALKNVRRLSKRPGLSENDQEWLLDREAYNLNNLGQVDELIIHYDRWIAAAEGDAKKRLCLLKEKAEMLGYHDRQEETLAAWRAYREAAERGRADWLNATQGLAEQLRKAGQHRAALELISEYLAVEKASWLMLDAADSQLALGENEQARALLDQAEEACRPLKASTNTLNIQAAARIEQRLQVLRARLEAKPQK